MSAIMRMELIRNSQRQKRNCLSNGIAVVMKIPCCIWLCEKEIITTRLLAKNICLLSHGAQCQLQCLLKQVNTISNYTTNTKANAISCAVVLLSSNPHRANYIIVD